jgi:hypothetical protein
MTLFHTQHPHSAELQLVPRALVRRPSSARARMSSSFLAAAGGRAADASAAAPAAPPAYTADDAAELLECCRYGDDDDIDSIRELLGRGVPVDHADEGGNTGLHKAAANGHLTVVRLLLRAGAPHGPNGAGNTPLHWAVQQGQLGVAKALLKGCDGLDVLAKNGFGKSAVTEAFARNEPALVEALLSHPSAKALEPAGADGADGEGGEGADGLEGEETHEFEFVAGGPRVLVRELAQVGLGAAEGELSGAILGVGAAADDMTGLQLWAASIVLAHWLVEMRAQLEGRALIELGAGCGLCGLVAAKLCGAGPCLLTDLAARTVDNLRHNVAANGLGEEQVRACSLDWRDAATYPAAVPVVIGADLVYADEAVPPLLAAVGALVARGGVFLYVAPETNRQGEGAFLRGLGDAGFECQTSAVPPHYLQRSLPERTDEEFEVLFAELRERTYTLYCFTRPAE